MIKGLSVNDTRPLPAAKPQQKTEKADENFANQLLGAKSERRENLDRNERKNSGRDNDREGSRSVEREKDSKSPSDLRASRGDVRKREPRPDVKSERDERERDEDREDDRVSVRSGALTPPSQSIQSPRMPASIPKTDDEAPIVIESPKGSDSQELKLPDFFSKTALGKGAKGVAANGKGEAEADETAGLMTAMKGDEAVNRQEAMEKFVEKMQSELGIPPEKLLQAFAQLDDKALQAPPQESMGQFMKALDLSPKQEAKAAQLYGDLLATTGASILNEHVAGMDQGVNFDVMSPRDASLRKLNSSLDDLNDSFFRKGSSLSEPKKAQSAIESMDLEIAKLMRSKTDANGASNLTTQNGLAANAMMADVMKESMSDAGDESVQASSDPNAQLASLLAGITGQMNGLQPGGSEGEGDLASAGKEAGEASIKSAGGKATLESAFAKEMSKELKDDDSSSGDVDLSSQSLKTIDAKVDPTAMPDQAQPMTGGAKTALMGPAEMMMNRQATSKDEQDNVRDLIREAQVMIKRGGGEMKMEMKPEGMGSIQLRVMVENGKVNVQMLTESESAKHLLEKGLSELKTNLAAHELKVQSMSVDVGNDVKNQMDQKGSQEHAREQARQFAENFMSDFRDERQGFRQGILENKGWRSYNKNKAPDQLQPEGVARAAAKSRSDDSKRLNLVA